jgi:hypothetical protein
MTAQRSESAARTLADADREHILEILEQANRLIGGRGGAANRLGFPRTTLIYKMRKLGIETRRSQRVRPIRQLSDARCNAAVGCLGINRRLGDLPVSFAGLRFFQGVYAFADGVSATAASVVSNRNVKVSCR